MHNVMRCQSLKIKSLPIEIETYYKSLQDDYKNVLQFLVESSGMGYLVWEDDNATIVDPNPPVGDLAAILDILKKGGIHAENCYGLFYEEKRSLSRPKKNSKSYNFAHTLNTFDDKDFYKKAAETGVLTVDDWVYYNNLVAMGKDIEVLWENEIADAIGNPNKGVSLAPKTRHFFPKIKEPKNRDYCTALMGMVVSSFNSWIECHQNHFAETEILEVKLKDKIESCPNVYRELLAFSDVLEQYNYGLSQKVLKKSLDYVKSGVGHEAFFAIPFAEIKNYPLLTSAEEKDVWNAYKALKIYWKLRNRKKKIYFYAANEGLSNSFRIDRSWHEI